jgi:hypothetical protein
MDYQSITDYFKSLRRVVRKFHDFSTEELQEILQADPSLYPVAIDLYVLDTKLHVFDQHICWKVLFPQPLYTYFPEEDSSEQEAPGSNIAAKPSGRPRQLRPRPDVDAIEEKKAAREKKEELRWRRQHRLGFFDMLGEEIIKELLGEDHLHLLGKRKDIGIPEEPRGEITGQAIIDSFIL